MPRAFQKRETRNQQIVHHLKPKTGRKRELHYTLYCIEICAQGFSNYWVKGNRGNGLVIYIQFHLPSPSPNIWCWSTDTTSSTTRRRGFCTRRCHAHKSKHPFQVNQYKLEGFCPRLVLIRMPYRHIANLVLVYSILDKRRLTFYSWTRHFYGNEYATCMVSWSYLDLPIHTFVAGSWEEQPEPCQTYGYKREHLQSLLIHI